MKKIVFCLLVSAFAFANIQPVEAVKDSECLVVDENEKSQGVTPKLKSESRKRKKNTCLPSNPPVEELEVPESLRNSELYRALHTPKRKGPNVLKIFGSTIYVYEAPFQ